MNIRFLTKLILVGVLFASFSFPVLAADIVVSCQITNTQIYDSSEGIIFDNPSLTSTADVTAIAAYEVFLEPGTSIAAGAKLSVIMKDNDGLDNRWETQYFSNLLANPSDDPDNDGMSNLVECNLGLDPTDGIIDTDSDGLPDLWEISFFGYDLSMGANDQSDSDGVTNLVEYKLGTDPTIGDLPGPGIHYEYDALGRITKIYRIPAQ